MEEILFKNECYKIIGCAIEVHKTLGYKFLENVYEEALSYEFDLNFIPYKNQYNINVYYKDKKLDKKYIADFICYDSILIELKAVDKIADEHIAQIINYLSATKMKLGLIINFGNKSLEFKRIII